MPTVDVTVSYLEMLDPSQLRPRMCDEPGWAVRPAPRDGTINRVFYCRVGADWTWIERLAWSDDSWSRYVDQPTLSTWIASVGKEPVGYYELDERPATGIEIVYFGLLPGFIGRGLGGAMLTDAICRAWQRKPRRVWLHTCTLDHPRALRALPGARDAALQNRDRTERHPIGWRTVFTLSSSRQEPVFYRTGAAYAEIFTTAGLDGPHAALSAPSRPAGITGLAYAPKSLNKCLLTKR